MNLAQLRAIDVHTHAEVSAREPMDELWKTRTEAMAKYFKGATDRPTVTQVAAYYRARNIGCVIFPVDSERASGEKRVSNEEVAELAAENSDVMIAFASIDPAKGRMGAREARRLIRDFGVKGFKFHPSLQEFFPNDRSAYVLYEAIAEAGLPALFHTGQTGVGAGMRGGGGVHLKYSNPMYVDDVAVDFPDMPTVKEQGFDVVFDLPRSVMGAKGLAPEQVRYWDGAFGRMVKTDAWRQAVEKNQWEDDYMNSADFGKSLKAQYEILKDVLTEIGMTKQ